MALTSFDPTRQRRALRYRNNLDPEEHSAINAFLEGGAAGPLLDWANNTQTRKELLASLADVPDPVIQRAVASNHSTPPNTLLTLGEIYPEDFLGNRAWLFEECFGNPFEPKAVEFIESLAAYRNQIDNGEHPTALVDFDRINIADRYANTVWSDYLSRDPKEEVRLALAQNLKGEIPHEVEARLLKDPRPDVRQTLAENTKLERRVYLALAEDPDLNVRRELASNTARVCEPAHFRLLEQGEQGILTALARNQSIEYPLTIQLCETGFQTRCELADNPMIDQETVAELVQQGERQVWLRLAANTGVIDAAICQFHSIDDPELMEVIVSNPKCPHLYLSILAHRGGEYVHLALIQREELPALVQLHIAQEGSPRTRRALLQRVASGKHQHNSPGMRKVCEVLAEDSEEDIRIGILSDSRLSGLFLSDKVQNASAEERRRIACNQSLPIEKLMQLCLKGDSSVNHNALRTLLWHAGKVARKVGTAKNPTATTAFRQIEDFLCDHLGEFTEAQRLLLLGHRDTPFGVLGQFSSEKCKQTWDALLLREFRYPFHLFPDPENPEEIHVLPNKKKPSREAILKHVTSANPYYRGWAVMHMPIPEDVMSEVRVDPSPYVQYITKIKLQNESPDTNRTNCVSAHHHH